MAATRAEFAAAGISPEPALAEEIERRAVALGGLVTVSVSDLLDPRPAFFRRLAPVPVDPERRRRQALGTERHARWVRRMGPSERVEVRVHREGVVGVIDLLEPDGPTELKTTARLPPPDVPWLEARGEYFDQLGLYAALTGASIGRLVVVGDAEADAPRPLVALRCEVRDGPVLLTEARARADRLRRALRSEDPGELPRCPWFGRSCEFERAGVCGCRGDEPTDDRWVRDRIAEVRREPEREPRWRSAIAEAEQAPAPTIHAFGELLYPRRAYYDRRGPYPDVPEAPPHDPFREAAYREIAAAIEAGPEGERSQRPSRTGEPPGAVPLFRGLPYVVKTRRGIAPTSTGASSPGLPSHYLEELGFRAAAAGVASGRLFLLYLGTPTVPRRLAVERVTFPSPAAWVAEFERRRSALAEALRAGDPSSLPPCPAWRWESCPYRATCGCRSSSAPS